MNSSANEPNASASAPRPVTPSAPLSSSLPATRSQHRHSFHRLRRRHHSHSPPTPAKPPLLTAPLPLPKEHIRRTPSELQLADDTARAEYEDVRMYARLVVGMQSRCREAGYVHPLTKKSLRDILKTKQARQEELENDHEDEEGWGWTHEEEEEETSVDTPRPCHPLGAGGKAPRLVKTPSQGSVASELSRGQEEEDECVFSLEL